MNTDYAKSIFLMSDGYASCEVPKVGCITINLEGNSYAFIYPDDDEVTVNINDEDIPNYDHGHIDMLTMIIKGDKRDYKIEKY